MEKHCRAMCWWKSALFKLHIWGPGSSNLSPPDPPWAPWPLQALTPPHTLSLPTPTLLDKSLMLFCEWLYRCRCWRVQEVLLFKAFSLESFLLKHCFQNKCTRRPFSCVSSTLLPALGLQSGQSSKRAAPGRKRQDSASFEKPSPVPPAGSWWRWCGCVSSCPCCFRHHRLFPADSPSHCSATFRRLPWRLGPSQPSIWSPFQVDQSLGPNQSLSGLNCLYLQKQEVCETLKSIIFIP